MYDTIEKFQQSLIQHGTHSNRIYLMKLDHSDMPQIVTQLDQMAISKHYTKVFAKVHTEYKQEFEALGFVEEATIPGFFNGTGDVSFMCKYFDDKRSLNTEKELIDKIVDVASSKFNDNISLDQCPYVIRKCTTEDVEQIVDVYKKVFESYPFPIYETDYILDTMKEHIVYYCVLDGDRIVALSSSEEDHKSLNSEMTDFATLEAYRGQNLSLYLLEKMEQDLKTRNFKTAYTIARSISYGMNITFAKMGYKYSGTLINNTNICGALESMNVWYKRV